MTTSRMMPSLIGSPHFDVQVQQMDWPHAGKLLENGLPEGYEIATVYEDEQMIIRLKAPENTRGSGQFALVLHRTEPGEPSFVVGTPEPYLHPRSSRPTRRPKRTAAWPGRDCGAGCRGSGWAAPCSH